MLSFAALDATYLVPIAYALQLGSTTYTQVHFSYGLSPPAPSLPRVSSLMMSHPSRLPLPLQVLLLLILQLLIDLRALGGLVAVVTCLGLR